VSSSVCVGPDRFFLDLMVIVVFFVGVVVVDWLVRRFWPGFRSPFEKRGKEEVE